MLQLQLQLMQLSEQQQQQQQPMLLNAGHSNHTWQHQRQQQEQQWTSQSQAMAELPAFGCTSFDSMMLGNSLTCDLAVAACSMPAPTPQLQLQQQCPADEDAAIAAVDEELFHLLELRHKLLEQAWVSAAAGPNSGSKAPVAARPQQQGASNPSSTNSSNCSGSVRTSQQAGMQLAQAAGWGVATPAVGPAAGAAAGMAAYVNQHQALQQRHRVCMKAVEAAALPSSSNSAAGLGAEAQAKLQELLDIQQLQLSIQDELLLLCSGSSQQA